MIAVALILGLVEGLTEFLPVSSTGHLILAGKLLNFTGEKAGIFEIFIQLGAILAVVGLFKERFLRLLPGQKSQGFSGFRGLGLLLATTLPALVLGLGLHKFIKNHLFNPLTVAIGLIAGALWILAVEKKNLKIKVRNLDELNWKKAFGIGFFQCLAMWPGFSRSGATILGGMVLGLDRTTAAEYSFFAAVPVICAASLYDLLKGIKEQAIQSSDFGFFAIGFFISMFSAWLAVKLFIRYVSKHNLNVFAWYRIVLAVLVFLMMK